MQPFEIKLIPKCFQDAKEYSGDDADFYLEENDWDDYGYSVLYFLHATKRFTGTDNELVGSLRIMMHGQGKTQRYLLRSAFKSSTFTYLPDGFISMAFENGFYDWLRHYSLEFRKQLASQLHLITGKEDPLFELVKDDDCFINGVLRDTTIDNYIFLKAREWIYDEVCRYDLRKQSFQIQYIDCEKPINLNFSCLTDFDSDHIPNGIVAFIGSNGHGKSTALYRLAKLMYLFPEDRRKQEEKIGRLIPNDVGVDRMILISYSPFDNFIMPSTENFAIRYYTDMPSEADSRFIYCGIRDLEAEFLSGCYPNGGLTTEFLCGDRISKTIPKDQERLAADFACAMKIIKCEEIGNEYNQVWWAIIEDAKLFHPQLAEHMGKLFGMKSLDERATYFKSLSTGYKFFLHSIAYVIAYITKGTLILFDEPENHIHPPLLSFMMSQYRKIMAKNKSVMLVSTHSPVIVQELFSDNVIKVSREGDRLLINKPQIETYGATFGEINSEVFNLTSDMSKYFDVFNLLYDGWKLSDSATADAMLKKAEELMPRGLSGQMSSYFIDKFYLDNPEKE